jgi:hypothetical protein
MASEQRKTIVWDIGALTDCPDVPTVDAFARLQLTLRAYGLELLLRGGSEEFVELVEFMGLAEVLRVEPRGQAEQRKERGGVEEERELDDLSF